jgi:hypothetical protein
MKKNVYVFFRAVIHYDHFMARTGRNFLYSQVKNDPRKNAETVHRGSGRKISRLLLTLKME